MRADPSKQMFGREQGCLRAVKLKEYLDDSERQLVDVSFTFN